MTWQHAQREEIVTQLRRGGLDPGTCRLVFSDDRAFIIHDGTDSVLLIQRAPASPGGLAVYSVRGKTRGLDDGSADNLHWPGILQCVNDFGASLA